MTEREVGMKEEISMNNRVVFIKLLKLSIIVWEILSSFTQKDYEENDRLSINICVNTSSYPY